MKPKDCIFFNLVKASKLSGQYWKTEVSDFEVTGIQAMVLNFLLDSEGAKASEIGKKASLDRATLTGIFDRLEEKNLVERRSVQGDRRATAIHLTTQGKKLAQKVRKQVTVSNDSYLENLSVDEIKQLKNLLNKIN